MGEEKDELKVGCIGLTLFLFSTCNFSIGHSRHLNSIQYVIVLYNIVCRANTAKRLLMLNRVHMYKDNHEHWTMNKLCRETGVYENTFTLQNFNSCLPQVHFTHHKTTKKGNNS